MFFLPPGIWESTPSPMVISCGSQMRRAVKCWTVKAPKRSKSQQTYPCLILPVGNRSCCLVPGHFVSECCFFCQLFWSLLTTLPGKINFKMYCTLRWLGTNCHGHQSKNSQLSWSIISDGGVEWGVKAFVVSWYDLYTNVSILQWYIVFRNWSAYSVGESRSSVSRCARATSGRRPDDSLVWA